MTIIISKRKKKNSEFNLVINYKRSFSDKAKKNFYKEFSTLVKSGIDFELSLDILVKQQKSAHNKLLLKQIKKDIKIGKSLHEAIKSTNNFSPYEYYSIKIGEETNKLPEVFKYLEDFFERKIRMRRQITSVLTYPVFVIIITFGVLFFMLHNVVPMFASVFKQFGGELPAITQQILYLSSHSTSILIVFIVIFILLLTIHYNFRKKENYRNTLSQFLLKIPFTGNLLKKIYLSRFSQAMSLLLSSKISLIKGLELTQQMVLFYPIERAIKQIRSDIIKGESLAFSMSKHQIFDYKIISMVKVAEEINKLDEMFKNLTIQLNEEIEHETKMIGVILEPLIIIIIGILVGIIMVAMYAPIFNLSKILERGF